jgi:hypothetical protein
LSVAKVERQHRLRCVRRDTQQHPVVQGANSMLRSFLLTYQEPSEACDSMGTVNQGTMTKTGAREETDQDIEGLLLGTNTRTDARESSDQDVDGLHMGTNTHTLSREQADQDAANESLGTRTETRTREGSDQDATHQSYAVIPRVRYASRHH